CPSARLLLPRRRRVAVERGGRLQWRDRAGFAPASLHLEALFGCRRSVYRRGSGRVKRNRGGQRGGSCCGCGGGATCGCGGGGCAIGGGGGRGAGGGGGGGAGGCCSGSGAAVRGGCGGAIGWGCGGGVGRGWRVGARV